MGPRLQGLLRGGWAAACPDEPSAGLPKTPADCTAADCAPALPDTTN